MFFQCKPGGLFVCFGFVFAPGYIHGFVVDSNLLGTVSNGIEKNEFCACILSPSQLFFLFFSFSLLVASTGLLLTAICWGNVSNGIKK